MTTGNSLFLPVYVYRNLEDISSVWERFAFPRARGESLA